MKTLKDLVNSAVDGLISRNESFSAHDVTTLIRSEVNSNPANLYALPTVFVGGKPRADINHPLVRDLVNERYQAGDLIRNLKITGGNNYFEYAPSNRIVPLSTPVQVVGNSAYDQLISTMAKVAQELVNVDPSVFKAELYGKGHTAATFFAAIGFDDLDSIEWIMNLEDEVGAEIDDAELDALLNKPVQDFINAIANYVNVPLPTSPLPKQPVPQPATSNSLINQIASYIHRNGPRTIKQIQSRFKKDPNRAVTNLDALISQSGKFSVLDRGAPSYNVVKLK